MMSPDSSPPTYRLLLIDDNPSIHEDLKKILCEDGTLADELAEEERFFFDTPQVRHARFLADSAYQGREGLALVEKSVAEGRPYALAFVDVRMPPGWDGVETVQHIWKVDPDIQIVICSAFSDYSWTGMVGKLGHSDSLVILKKPFDNIEVVQLAHALGRKWTVSREARVKRQDLERMVAQATAELHHNANHDPLTGLPNRRYFGDRLEQAIEEACEQGSRAGLLYVDLDGFKTINDTLGHGLGDRLLRQVAGRMQERLGQDQTLARMGGDEFTLIASQVASTEDLRCLAEKLQESFRDPFQIEGRQLYLSASMGASLYPGDGRHVAELLRNADAALYEAKRQGKNRTVFYTPSIGHAASERLELEIHLRPALEQREFTIHYQPEFSLETQRLVRFEALLRWDHPLLGSVSPARFIPVAEDCGLIVPIGTWVLEEACRTARRWHEAGCQKVPVAVNVSAHQIARPDFIDTVLAVIERVGLDPSLLELELTETVVVRDLDSVAPKLSRLREAGIRASIDDFGSGYSSFSYLQHLPVDAVKIDRSFILQAEATPKGQSVIRGMVALAHSIGLRVVVEGVETASQLEALVGSGADEVQGFLLGRPAPVERHVPALLPAPEPHPAGSR